MKNFTFHKTVSAALALSMTFALTACGGEAKPAGDADKTYKIGICNYVDDASLNQINADGDWGRKGCNLRNLL